MKAHDPEARHRDCIRCGRPGETRTAHYNGFRQHRLGKGRGVKGDMLASAEFCHECDQLFSESSQAWPGGSKNIERSEEFLFYCILTQIRKSGG